MAWNSSDFHREPNRLALQPSGRYNLHYYLRAAACEVRPVHLSEAASYLHCNGRLKLLARKRCIVLQTESNNRRLFQPSSRAATTYAVHHCADYLFYSTSFWRFVVNSFRTVLNRILWRTDSMKRCRSCHLLDVSLHTCHQLRLVHGSNFFKPTQATNYR